jgi:cytoskeletal protein CcmA (bactofilin family)
MPNPDQSDTSIRSSAEQSTQGSGKIDPQIRALLSTGESATIGKGLLIRGEITGTDSLIVEGRVEGSIHLEGNRVTVGRNGQAAANITAREVVVLGKVRGNITATDRLDIRAEGGVMGDLSAPRISIEDGAFFKGGIDIRNPELKPGGHNGQPRASSRLNKSAS